MKLLKDFPLVESLYALILDRQAAPQPKDTEAVVLDIFNVIKQMVSLDVPPADWDETLDAQTVMNTLYEIETFCAYFEIHGTNRMQHTILNLKVHVRNLISNYRPQFSGQSSTGQ